MLNLGALFNIKNAGTFEAGPYTTATRQSDRSAGGICQCHLAFRLELALQTLAFCALPCLQVFQRRLQLYDFLPLNIALPLEKPEHASESLSTAIAYLRGKTVIRNEGTTLRFGTTIPCVRSAALVGSAFAQWKALTRHSAVPSRRKERRRTGYPNARHGDTQQN